MKNMTVRIFFTVIFTLAIVLLFYGFNLLLIYKIPDFCIYFAAGYIACIVDDAVINNLNKK